MTSIKRFIVYLFHSVSGLYDLQKQWTHFYVYLLFLFKSQCADKITGKNSMYE